MKKLLGGLLGVLVLAGIAVLLLVSNLDGIVKTAIERIGSSTLGTQVTVDSVTISLGDGKGSIRGLAVANPKGFPAGEAFALSEITLDLELASLTEQPYVIQQIVVDGTELNFVALSNGSSNLQTIANNMGIDGSNQVSGDGNSESVEGEGTLLIIDAFRFSGTALSTEVEGVPQASRTLSIPDVVAANIGRAEGGVTPDVAAQQIVRPLINQAIARAKSAIEDEIKDKAVDAAKEEATRQLMKKLR